MSHSKFHPRGDCLTWVFKGNPEGFTSSLRAWSAERSIRLFYYLQLFQNYERRLIIRAFCHLYLPEKVTLCAILIFLCKGSLHFTLAECASNHPACPTRILSPMESIESFICCRSANPTFFYVLSSWFPSALHHFPAVLFQ